jgi:cytochrome c
MRVNGFFSACIVGTSLFTASHALAQNCNLAEGARLFQEQQCAGCHTYVPDDFDKSGPNLAGLFGRRAGTVNFPPGFSVALKNAGVVWSVDTVDRWLANPAAMLPGTTMPFAGLADAAARKTLVCFLQEKTK